MFRPRRPGMIGGMETQRHPRLDGLLWLGAIGGLALSAQIGLGILVVSVFEWGVAGMLWGLGVLACAGSTALGLVTRASRRGSSTVFLCIGALGPTLALFWLPPIYLVSVATIALAIATARRNAQPATAR